MKKSYITILILSIINSIVLTGIIIVLIIGNSKPMDSPETLKMFAKQMGITPVWL